MIGIYKITSPSERIYIGQSVDIDRRFAKYNSIENTKEQPALVRSFIKYGVINHIFEVIEECEIEELNIRERYWQEFYDVLKYGLNCQLVPTDTLPMIVSEETKKKIGDGNRGKILSEETKRKISENNAKSMLGKKHKPESIKKFRDFNLGKKLSDETKLKMSQSRKGDKHHYFGKKLSKEHYDKILKSRKENYHPGQHGMAKKVINTLTGEIYNSAKEVADILEIKVTIFRKMLRLEIKNKTNYIYYINDK